MTRLSFRAWREIFQPFSRSQGIDPNKETTLRDERCDPLLLERNDHVKLERVSLSLNRLTGAIRLREIRILARIIHAQRKNYDTVSIEG